MSEGVPNLRPRRACDACRRKRTRCDGSSDNKPCSTCVSKQLSCTYNETSKKAGIPKGYVSDLEERMRNLEILAAKVVPDGNLLEQIGPSFTLDTWLERHHAGPTAHLGSSLNVPMTSRRGSPAIYPAPEAIVRIRSVAPTPYDDGDGATQIPQDDDVLESGEIDLIEQATGRYYGRYHGSASAVHLVKTGIAMKQDILGHELPRNIQTVPPTLRPKFWNINAWEMIPTFQGDWSLMFHFPPKDLGHSLVDLFFTNFNLHYPLFDQASYLEDVSKEKYKSSIRHAAVYLLICAIGSKWSDDPRVCVSPDLSDGELDFLSSGWKYFIQICALPPPSPFSPPTLQDLQISALAAFFAISTSVCQTGWHISGIGLRLAVDVGAHRRNGNGGSSARPLNEDQWWKRVFWTLTVFDKASSSVHGWPIALHDEDFDADLPLDVDEEYWPKDNSSVPKQPECKPARITAFVLRLKLCQILGHTLSTIYTINKSKVHFGFTGEKWQQHILSELDSRMNQWNDSIPDHLKWNPSNTDPFFLSQSAMLYFSYLGIQIEIHRPYIPWLPNSRQKAHTSAVSGPSLLICTNASKQIGHALPTLIEKKVAVMPEIMKSATMAAVVITVICLMKIQDARRSGQDTVVDLSAEKETLLNCVKYLDLASERWYIAGYASDVIKEIANPTGFFTDYKMGCQAPVKATFSTRDTLSSDPVLNETFTTTSTSSSPWTRFSGAPSATSSPPSSFDYGCDPSIPNPSAHSRDPLGATPIFNFSNTQPNPASSFNSNFPSKRQSRSANIDPTNWHQFQDEEVVTIRPSDWVDPLRPTVGASSSFDPTLLTGQNNEAVMESNRIRPMATKPGPTFTQPYPPFVGNRTSSGEEPSYMEMFSCLAQAGMGGRANGTNMEDGMNYMRQMFQSLVPSDGVNTAFPGPASDFSPHDRLSASRSEPHQPDGTDEHSSSFDQILRQLGWTNEDWSRSEVMNVGESIRRA